MAVTSIQGLIKMGRTCSGGGRHVYVPVTLIVAVFLFAVAAANPKGCGGSVQRVLQERGYNFPGYLEKPQTSAICGPDSCCSDSLEKELSNLSQNHVEKFLKDAVLKVAVLIETRAKKFDETFRMMMDTSKVEFHSMFEKTYGKIYLQNSEVFTDFFNELDTYYKKGTVRLAESMEAFFGILYQRMFMVLNAQYDLEENYMICVNNHMHDMKPFGDVPHKLTQQLKRSFVATRTFYKSLVQAAEEIRKVPDLKFDAQCIRQMAQMENCGICRGEQGAGACSQYCSDSVHSCLRSHLEISESWDTFVGGIEKLADKLIGPYNVALVVEPLNIKISEAIMNFQEMGKEISQKIQSKCGTLELDSPRVRRQAAAAAAAAAYDDNPKLEIPKEPKKPLLGGKKKSKAGKEKVDNTPQFDRLIEDIKMKLKNTKHFWLQLPYHYCNNDTISAAPSNESCWNGTATGVYTQPKSNIDQNTHNPTIQGHIFALDSLNDRLRKAFQGQDVEIVDDTEESFDGSGSGSGDDGYSEEDDAHIDNEHIDSSSTSSTTTSIPEVILRTSSGGTSTKHTTSQMSLTRALMQLLLPVVMVWFGGAIKDLL